MRVHRNNRFIRGHDNVLPRFEASYRRLPALRWLSPHSCVWPQGRRSSLMTRLSRPSDTRQPAGRAGAEVDGLLTTPFVMRQLVPSPRRGAIRDIAVRCP